MSVPTNVKEAGASNALTEQSAGEMGDEDKADLRCVERLKVLLEFRGNKRKRKLHGEPEELFDKRYISAMKLSDQEMMFETDYVLITDNWRTDWQRGVQIRVSESREREAHCSKVKPQSNFGAFFRLPPTRYIHDEKPVLRKPVISKDAPHVTGDVTDRKRARKVLRRIVPRYNADALDYAWLDSVSERDTNDSPLTQASSEDRESEVETLERVFWMLDALADQRLHEAGYESKFENGQSGSGALELDANTASLLRSGSAAASSPKCTLAVNEHDESTVCDVCRAGDVEEGNEIVFCEGCSVAVHQACYGILEVPTGDWFCRACDWRRRREDAHEVDEYDVDGDGEQRKPVCALCLEPGGALKPTATDGGTRRGNVRSSSYSDGQVRWCHVSCVLWIPECTLGDVTLMEPVCRLDAVPRARYALECSVCRKRRGACAQCAAPHCCRAFHVPCAFRAALRMDTVLTERNEVRLLAYCPQHSAPAPKARLARARVINSSLGYSPTSSRRAHAHAHAQITDDAEEPEHTLDSRAVRLADLVDHSAVIDLARRLGVSRKLVARIASYWLLRRTSESAIVDRTRPTERALATDLPVLWPALFNGPRREKDSRRKTSTKKNNDLRPLADANANTSAPIKPEIDTAESTKRRTKLITVDEAVNAAPSVRRHTRRPPSESTLILKPDTIGCTKSNANDAVARLRHVRDAVARGRDLCAMVMRREILRAQATRLQVEICERQIRYFYFADDFEKLRPSTTHRNRNDADGDERQWFKVAAAHLGESEIESESVCRKPPFDCASESHVLEDRLLGDSPTENKCVFNFQSPSRLLPRNGFHTHTAPSRRERRSRHRPLTSSACDGCTTPVAKTPALMPTSDNLFAALEAINWQCNGNS